MITAGPAEVRRSAVIFPGVLTKAATHFKEFAHLPSRSELIYRCCWKCKSTRQIGRREVLAPQSSHHPFSWLTSHQSPTHWHMATLIGCNQSALPVKPPAIQEDDHVANPPLSDTADVYPVGSCGRDFRCWNCRAAGHRLTGGAPRGCNKRGTRVNRRRKPDFTDFGSLSESPSTRRENKQERATKILKQWPTPS